VPYVYRRPFDYPQHRQAFNHWYLAGMLEAIPATAAFTTYPAGITSTGGASDQSSHTTRFGSPGIYRKRWSYATHNARINLFYTDATEVQAQPTAGAFATHVAFVQLGSSPGATIAALLDTSAFTTYTAGITGGSRNPIEDAVGEFQTYPAGVTGTRGLGESRVGSVPARGSGNYKPVRLNTKGRSGRRLSSLSEIIKRK